MYRLILRQIFPINEPAVDVHVGPWHETAQAAFDEIRCQIKLSNGKDMAPSDRWKLHCSFLPLMENDAGGRTLMKSMNLNYE